MSTESFQGEITPLNLKFEFQKEVEILRKMVDEAYRNSVPISWKLALNGPNLDENLPADARNGVWVENPHFYPILLELAFKKYHLSNKELRKTINDTVEHELQHLVPVIGKPDLYPRLGIRFYKVKGLPFLRTFQPEIYFLGEITQSEDIDITTNVRQLSDSDEADLKKLEPVTRILLSKEKKTSHPMIDLETRQPT